MTKDIEQGQTLTYADVELDEDSMIRVALGVDGYVTEHIAVEIEAVFEIA